jgi:hypothetical protein
MIGVENSNTQGVSEDGGRFDEPDSMLQDIGLGFFRIPLEFDHRHPSLMGAHPAKARLWESRFYGGIVLHIRPITGHLMIL